VPPSIFDAERLAAERGREMILVGKNGRKGGYLSSASAKSVLPRADDTARDNYDTGMNVTPEYFATNTRMIFEIFI